MARILIVDDEPDIRLSLEEDLRRQGHETESAIDRYEDLRKQKLNIGKMDLRIAAIVLQHDAILVTRNTQDFCRIPGLLLENWSE